MKRSFTLKIIALLFFVLPVCALFAVPPQPPPVQLTAEQDHQRMMALLQIKSLRPGRDGMNPQAENYANYDESKANPCPNLPNPLILKNGQKVTTPEIWWT